MLSKPYQDKLIYNEIGDIDTDYELIILPEINGEVIVVITALQESSEISIVNFYEKIATQVYYEYLQETKINNIIWVEQIIHQKNKETFFQVDLSWDESLQVFHSPQWEPCNEEIIVCIKTFCSKASYSKYVH